MIRSEYEAEDEAVAAVLGQVEDFGLATQRKILYLATEIVDDRLAMRKRGIESFGQKLSEWKAAADQKENQ